MMKLKLSATSTTIQSFWRLKITKNKYSLGDKVYTFAQLLKAMGLPKDTLKYYLYQKKFTPDEIKIYRQNRMTKKEKHSENKRLKTVAEIIAKEESTKKENQIELEKRNKLVKIMSVPINPLKSVYLLMGLGAFDKWNEKKNEVR